VRPANARPWLTSASARPAKREHELDKRGQSLGSGAVTLEQRGLETIERLALSRSASTARKPGPRGPKRAASGSKPRSTGPLRKANGAWEARLRDPGRLAKRAGELRTQALTAIEALARTEEEIARIHEELGAGRPGRRDEYRRTAGQARQTTRQAREVWRVFTG
jgi:hypothetical protein